jgi:hypothetical protein
VPVLAAAVSLAAAGAPATAALLDGLVAIVGSRVITISDARLLTALGLVEGEAAADGGLPLRALVDRALMVAEVERFQAPDPLVSRVNEEVARFRARAGDAEWTALLRRNGADEERVRAMVREELQLRTYLEQRFGVLAEPSDEALRQAYQARQAALPPGGTLPPFEALRDELWREARAARYGALLAEWVAELRGRADLSTGGLVESPQR